MKRILISIFIAFLVVRFTPVLLSELFNLFDIELYKKPVFSFPPDELQYITFDSLFAHPEMYQDKEIKISGYLQLQFENCVLYPGNPKTYMYNGSQIKCLWVDIRQTDSLIFSYNNIEYDLRDVDIKYLYRTYNNKYVDLKGIFDINNKGHFDMYLGSLKKISSIKLRSPELDLSNTRM